MKNILTRYKTQPNPFYKKLTALRALTFLRKVIVYLSTKTSSSMELRFRQIPQALATITRTLGPEPSQLRKSEKK